MTDKILPPGDYIIRVLAIGGRFADGGLLLQRWTTPFAPSLISQAAAGGVDVCAPKLLDDLPAGSWLAFGIEWRPGSLNGRAMYLQDRVETALAGRAEIFALVTQRLPIAVEAIAEEMVRHIGIEPTRFIANPSEHPTRPN